MRKLLLFILLFFTLGIYSQVCLTTDIRESTIIFTLNDSIPTDESEYSIGDTIKVKFVHGNLQYQPSTNTWRIATRQYDYVGGYYGGDSDLPRGEYGTVYEIINGVRTKCSNANNSSSYQGWIDLFTFGTGDLHGTDIVTGKTYRTPTESEYKYLFEKRPNADKLRGRASIILPGDNAADTTVNGIIVMPDDWDPAILPHKIFKSDYDGCQFYRDNIYTVNDWYILEAQGAIFFPAAGAASGNTKYNRSGFYWTGTSASSDKAASLEFGGFRANINDIPSFTNQAKTNKRAIRLCEEVRE